jgi:hypothetical protein
MYPGSFAWQEMLVNVPAPEAGSPGMYSQSSDGIKPLFNAKETDLPPETTPDKGIRRNRNDERREINSVPS